MEITMEKKYYVYAYLDPREKGDYNFGNYSFKNKPFYIGKGKDGSNRLEKHLKLIKEQNKDLTNNNYKLNVINQILKDGFEPIIIKIVEGSNLKIASINLGRSLTSSSHLLLFCLNCKTMIFSPIFIKLFCSEICFRKRFKVFEKTTNSVG